MTMTFIDWLTSTIGTAAILTALVGAFWQVIMNRVTASVKSRYDKDLASHIDSLRKNTDTILKDLEFKANERNIKLKEVFEQQAKVVAETYSKIVQLLQSIKDYTLTVLDSSDSEGQQIEETFFKNWKDLKTYYEQNRIYLPKDIQEDIEAFVDPLTEKAIEFHLWNKGGRNHGRGKNPWMEIQQLVRNGSEQPMANLDKKFKKILELD